MTGMGQPSADKDKYRNLDKPRREQLRVGSASARNVGIGRTTDSLMMMVTPRIIIQEEEEERLGFTAADQGTY